jgi:16S rRNA (guanine527-N7)-methyltransferase
VPQRRLAELADQYSLTPAVVERLERLLSLLAEAPEAHTTVTEPTTAVDVHVADSLSGLLVPAARDARRIADLGSGAGFPALVFAIARPDARVTAVESALRKCRFIEETAATLRLGNVSVVCMRAEEWSDGLGANDVVCARALAPLGVIFEYAAPLLAHGGTVIAWKGQIDDEERDVAVRAAAELGLTAPDFMPVKPYAGSEHRRLAVSVKQYPTPDRFPRRTGVAQKRPLGASGGPTRQKPASDRIAEVPPTQT